MPRSASGSAGPCRRGDVAAALAPPRPRNATQAPGSGALAKASLRSATVAVGSMFTVPQGPLRGSEAPRSEAQDAERSAEVVDFYCRHRCRSCSEGRKCYSQPPGNAAHHTMVAHIFRQRVNKRLGQMAANMQLHKGSGPWTACEPAVRTVRSLPATSK